MPTQSVGNKSAEKTRRLEEEIEALKQERAVLARRAREYELLYELAPDLCITADTADGTIIGCNHTVAQANGYSKEELLGRSVFELYPPDEHERLLAVFQSVLEGSGVSDVEFTGLRKNGSTFTMSLSVTPVRGADGRVAAGHGVVRDISERKRAEQARVQLVRELDHRVKNAIATVQAIADQTILASTSLEDFAPRFRGRLAALARIHEAISENEWQGLELERLVELTLAPFADQGGRIRSHGPATELPAEAARPVGMVLHELATNAGKYGALSHEAGSVEIEWTIDERAGWPRLHLHWIERGGPPVLAPTRRGFGRRMIEDVVPYELEGCVALSFPKSGVQCDIEFFL